MKLLLSVFLLALAAVLFLALALNLVFLCRSKRGSAIVTSIAVTETEDSDGGVQRDRRIAIRFQVDGRSHEAGNLAVLADYAVGSEVAIRYRRSNPQDVHVEYWGTLFMLSVFAPLAASGAWLAVTWPL